MAHSGAVIILFCTVNWLNVEQLNIEVGEGLVGEMRKLNPSPPGHSVTLNTAINPSKCSGNHHLLSFNEQTQYLISISPIMNTCCLFSLPRFCHERDNTDFMAGM